MLKPLLCRIPSAFPLHSVRYTCTSLVLARPISGVGPRPAADLRRSMATDSEPSRDKQSRFRGPASWRHFFITMGAGFVAGACVYFFVKRMMQQRVRAKQKRLEAGFGTPKIGGPWELVDFDNKVRKDSDFLGQWVLIYFGFTHCPDICPEELEKMCTIVNRIDNDPKLPNVTPLFFTVDPVRDTPDKMKKYCLEYSPKLLGLGGSMEQVKTVCKTFRVYFGLGPKDPDGDYIVDHTVVIFVINPEGRYVDHFIREPSADRIFDKISEHIVNYEKKQRRPSVPASVTS